MDIDMGELGALCETLLGGEWQSLTASTDNYDIILARNVSLLKTTARPASTQLDDTRSPAGAEIMRAVGAGSVVTCVREGDQVAEGETLFVLHVLDRREPHAAKAKGTVETILVSSGMFVEHQQPVLLLRKEPATP